MRQTILLTVLIGLAFLFPVFAAANDTVGEEGAGGLEFKKTDDIAMEKEVLTISHSRVRVEYEFINRADHSVTERVFFPMPFYSPDNLHCHSGHGGGPLEGFTVWVNGKQVDTTWTVRAVLSSGEDITGRLKKRGLSDQDIADFKGLIVLCEDENDDPVSASEAAQKLAAYGLTEAWDVSYVYYWDQQFPSGSKIKVVHEYIPRIGTDSGRLSFKGEGGIKSVQGLIARLQHGGVETYCIDNGTYRAAQKSEQVRGDSLRYAVVAYILTTGANWSGPIKDFTLNLEKDRPTDVVSLCFDGKFRRTDSLTLTSHIEDFIPKKDLQVLFLFQ